MRKDIKHVEASQRLKSMDRLKSREITQLRRADQQENLSEIHLKDMYQKAMLVQKHQTIAAMQEQQRQYQEYMQVMRQQQEHNRMKVMKVARNPVQEMRLRFLQPQYELEKRTSKNS